MFLSKFTSEEALHLKNACQDDGLMPLLARLQKGEFQILWHFDEADDRLIYEAISSGETEPSYLGLAVGADHSLSSFPKENFTQDFYALAFYLYSEEKTLMSHDPEALKKKYGEIYKSIEPLLSLSPRQIEKRLQIRNQFIQSVLFVEKESEASANTDAYKNGAKLHLEVLFQSLNSYYGEGRVYLRLYLLSEKAERFSLNDIPNFLMTYRSGGNLTLKKGKSALSLKLAPSLFSEEDQALLSALAQVNFSLVNTYETKKDLLELESEDVLRLLSLYAGSSVSWDNDRYDVIKSDKQAGLFLTPDETMSFFPSLERVGNTLYSRKLLAVIDRLRKKFTLYDFPSEEIGELYSFFLINGSEVFGDVKDLIQKRVVPHLGSSLTTPRLPNENQANTSLLTIRYDIDLTEQGELLFKSRYQLGDKEVERSSLDGSLYYTSLLFSFDNVRDELHLPESGTLKDETQVLAFFKTDLTKLKKVAEVYLSERLKRVSLHSIGKISFNVSSHLDFLSLSASCPDYSQEQLAEILSSYRKKHRFFRLGDRIVMLDDPALEELDRVSQEVGLDETHLKQEKLPLYAVMKLSAANKETTLSLDDYVRKAIEEIRDFKSFPLELAPVLAKKMRGYQLDATRWMSVLRKYHLSGILADDMGMGKTLESIAFMSTITEEAPILVVAPKSVLYNWEAEFQKWLPSLKVVVLSGEKGERENSILGMGKEKAAYVTSYDSLRNDLPLYEKKHFSLILVDEGQYIKNAYAQKSKAVKELDATTRFALTGTPIENNLGDLWSLFDFLMPGFLGDYDSFQIHYVKNEANAKLRQLITPFILRRNKEEYLKELPKKSLQIVTLSMGDEERKLYDATLLEAKNLLAKGEKGVSIFALLTKLREICVDSSAFFEGTSTLSSKMSYLLEAVEEAIANGHKILLFSSFTKVLDHLRYLLDEEHLSSYYINGDTESSLRLKIANSFNTSDQVKILLVSLKAGGSGLNLQGADTVFHIDPWWNLAVEEQATDRAHRIGQIHPVQVYKLICHDTIEEKVISLQEKKKALYRSVINEGETGITSLSVEDLLYLLS